MDLGGDLRMDLWTGQRMNLRAELRHYNGPIDGSTDGPSNGLMDRPTKGPTDGSEVGPTDGGMILWEHSYIT